MAGRPELYPFKTMKVWGEYFHPCEKDQMTRQRLFAAAYKIGKPRGWKFIVRWAGGGYKVCRID